MRPTLLALLTLLFCHAAQLGAQPQSPTVTYLSAKDSIELHIDAAGNKFFYYALRPGEHLYGLGRYFGLSVADLEYYNPALQGRSPQPGERVKITVPNRAIFRSLPVGAMAGKYLPLFYAVKKGDTMYRISRKHFGCTEAEMMLRNGLENPTLRVGQRLHVGWMGTGGIPDSLRQVGGALGDIWQQSQRHHEGFLKMAEQGRLLASQGTAHWSKGRNTLISGAVALHRNAPVNSIIEVLNPMSGRRVYLKVLGNIPDAKAPYELVIPDEVAHMLGAIDADFFVKTQQLSPR